MLCTRTLLILALLPGMGGGAAALDTVTRIDGETVFGDVTNVETRGTVLVFVGGVSAGRLTRIPSTEVLSIHFDGTDADVDAAGADLVVVASGERYWVKTWRSKKAKLVCSGAKSLIGSGAEVAIPFGDLRAWVPAKRTTTEKGPAEDAFDLPDTETVVKELLALENDRDVVILTNGDRLTGVVEVMTPGNVTVSAKVGRVTVARAKIRGVAFSKTFKPYTEPEGLLAEVHLADGSTVLGRIHGGVGPVHVLHSVLGPIWKTSDKSLRKIEFRGGKLVWLSEVKPSSVEMTPFFNRSWRWRADRSVWGNPLTVAGAVYERGLGVHSRTRLTYDIGGKYATFIADIGIDDETRGTGSALFSVEADGDPRLKPVEMSGGRKPRRVKLDITGVRHLTLLVDFGKDQDLGDHADWLNARLIRK